MPKAFDGRTVLSIQQPWADWIVDGFKDVENRSWKTEFRGRLWIHASRKVDKGAMLWVERTFGKDYARDLDRGEPRTLGAIIGHVDLITCADTSPSLWWTGAVAWILQNPKRTTPEPKRGRLGLWIAGNQP